MKGQNVRVRVLKPVRYAGKRREKDEHLEIPAGDARLLAAIGKVVEVPPETKVERPARAPRQYRRRDMVAEGTDE